MGSIMGNAGRGHLNRMHSNFMFFHFLFKIPDASTGPAAIQEGPLSMPGTTGVTVQDGFLIDPPSGNINIVLPEFSY